MKKFSIGCAGIFLFACSAVAQTRQSEPLTLCTLQSKHSASAQAVRVKFKLMANFERMVAYDPRCKGVTVEIRYPDQQDDQWEKFHKDLVRGFGPGGLVDFDLDVSGVFTSADTDHPNGQLSMKKLWSYSMDDFSIPPLKPPPHTAADSSDKPPSQR
ncbi:MAG: hypothetical protein ABI740_07110 [Alphaproteobacteria bacterium]